VAKLRKPGMPNLKISKCMFPVFLKKIPKKSEIIEIRGSVGFMIGDDIFAVIAIAFYTLFLKVKARCTILYQSNFLTLFTHHKRFQYG
jgi:hypothetical protein